MNFKRNRFNAFSAALALALGSLAVGTHAAGTHGHDKAGAIGEPGDPSRVSRTIEIVMLDNYYEPEELDIKEGETVKFLVHNKGALVHEFNIATAAMHKAHQPEMLMMVQHGVLMGDRIDHAAAKAMQASMGHGMHDEPNSVLLEPGKSAEIVWKFPEHAELEFACNVPGHYDAGMQGPIKLSH
jgi:uncharacterized cupredoxin-like copper-binding protein